MGFEETARKLRMTGQVASFVEIEGQVAEFERILKSHGLVIQPGSDLEAACLSVTDVLGKHQSPELRNPHEDIRLVFTELLGIWSFLTKIIRLATHPNFSQFVEHLKLLNEGTVAQNKRMRACEEATNKIFELLFALVLLDVGTDLLLDDPNLARGDNPDILVNLAGQRWGFACKAVYGASGKTLFDNIKKGIQQIEVSEATVGCVVINFRNQIDHQAFWPILNEAEYRAGGEPIFGAAPDASLFGEELCSQVTIKRDQIVEDIGAQNVLNIFEHQKSLPAFLAFCQTSTANATAAGPVPSLVSALVLGKFASCDIHMPVFEQINRALHERQKWGQTEGQI